MTPYRGTGHTLEGVEAMTIGQLAFDAGVHVETIRYYERRGLLREPPRTAAGYRQYSSDDRRRLQLIIRAKGLGFTLTEIARLLGADTTTTSDAVRLAALAKLRSLDEQLRSVRETRARLELLLAICEDPDDEDCASLHLPR